MIDRYREAANLSTDKTVEATVMVAIANSG